MLQYQGPCFKIIHHLGALPGLTNKRPRARNDLRNQLCSREKSQYRNSLNSFLHEELPKHLTLYPFQYKGLVNQIIDSKWVGLKINALLVVEYYSCLT
ncbi:hypothetical protein NMG60_11008390 [Bertholletia excelsa]